MSQSKVWSAGVVGQKLIVTFRSKVRSLFFSFFILLFHSNHFWSGVLQHDRCVDGKTKTIETQREPLTKLPDFPVMQFDYFDRLL